MIAGALVGLLTLAVISLAVNLHPDVASFKPHTHIWVLFGAVGALIGMAV